MPDLPLQIIGLITDLLFFLFIGYYFFRFRAKESELSEKEDKIDTDYHRIVDTALAKERKILEDATSEADQIIAGAQHINQTVKDEINQALQAMVADIQKEAFTTAQNFTTDYQLSLKQAATQSLADFKNIISTLEEDLKNQLSDVRGTLLPNLEKELNDYKQTRFNQIEDQVAKVIQTAAPEIFNRTISLDDHKDLVIESLAKAKKAGVFD